MKTTTARTAATLALFIATAYLLRGSLVAICWSALIAVSTWPLHERVQRRFGRRGKATSAALLALAGVLVLLLPLVYLTYHGLREIPALLRVWASSNDAGLPAPDWLEHVPFVGAWATAQWNAEIAEPGALSDFVHAWTSRINFQAGRGLVAELGHRAMSVFFCILVLFFLYLEGDRLAAQFQTVVRHYLGASGARTTRIAVATVRQTVNGLLVVALGLALTMCLAYAAAGLPHPAFWGLVTGVLGIVPFGAGVALVAASIFLLAAQHATAAAVLLVLGAILIFVVDHFIRPALISGPLRMPLVLALLGIVGGLETLGLLGLFVGPTLLAISVAVWREVAAPATDGAAAPEPVERA